MKARTIFSVKNMIKYFLFVIGSINLANDCWAVRALRQSSIENDILPSNSFFGPTALFIGKKIILDCIIKPDENISIKCEQLEGKGVLSAPIIKITVGVFSFTGILECSNECIITTRVPVDTRTFSLKNPDKVTFICNPNLEKFVQGGNIHFKHQ